MARRPPKPADLPSNPRTKGTAPKSTIANLIRDGKTSEDFAQIDREIADIHPRSAAILLAAGIERSLEYALIIRLPRNDNKTIKLLVERDGPLNGFSAKICLAYAMRIIDDDALHDLNIIRRVRNAFAHAARPINFSTEEITNECSGFRTVVNETENPGSKLPYIIDKLSDDPVRLRFTLTCRTLSHTIVLAPAATFSMA